MNGIAALGFLEWRQIVNRIKSILKSPGRSIFYVLIIAYFILMGFLRLKHGGPAPRFSEPFTSALFFAFITVVAVVAYGAASGFTGAFSSVADARFLIGSRMNPRTVVLWLQLRRCASLMLRMALSLLFYSIVAYRSAASLGLALAVLSATAATAAISVPVLKLRAAIGTRVTQAMAGALAAIALLPMLIVLSGYIRPNPVARGVVHLGAGRITNALLNADLHALLPLWIVCAAFLVLAWRCGDDLYPELYASSLRALSFRQRTRGGASIAFRPRADYRERAGSGAFFRVFDALRGPWSVAWKEWLAFIRSPGAQRIFAFSIAGSAFAGWFLGTAAMRTHSPLRQSLEFFPAIFMGFMVFVAMGSALTLSSDLSKPIWWVGPHSLRSRLAAWVCATSWRTGAIMFSGIAAWALALHLPQLVAAALPAAAVLVVYLRAVGLAIYSIFPSTIDQRGPMGAVRLLLTYAFCIPPAIAGVAAGYFLHSIPIGTAAALLAGLAEVYLLIAFAAARITGSGAAFAQAEGA